MDALASWFDLGLRDRQRARWTSFAEPVVGLRLYFRCRCRRRAAVFPWISQEWEVLLPEDGYARVCVRHGGIDVC
jgi:hypothetical protein